MISTFEFLFLYRRLDFSIDDFDFCFWVILEDIFITKI